MVVKEISMEAPRGAATTVSVSTTSAQSAVLSPGSYIYTCDQVSYLLFGSNPTATLSCLRIPAETMVRIAGVQSGEKLAIIADASGTAWLAPAI